jgi:hypothetical protein
MMLSVIVVSSRGSRRGSGPVGGPGGKARVHQRSARARGAVVVGKPDCQFGYAPTRRHVTDHVFQPIEETR